jgi:hypothetical protein
VKSIITDISPMRERCCDSHTETCEPPSELCCDQCSEVDHPHHQVHPWCVLTTPPGLVDDIAAMLGRIQCNYEREGTGPGSRFEGQRLEFAQAQMVVREVLRYRRTTGR